MKATLSRIFYKYYLIAIFFSVWSGLILIEAFSWFYQDTVWGMFLIIAGCVLAWSERGFIKECNQIYSGKTETIRVGDMLIKSSYGPLNYKCENCGFTVENAEHIRPSARKIVEQEKP